MYLVSGEQAAFYVSWSSSAKTRSFCMNPEIRVSFFFRAIFVASNETNGTGGISYIDYRYNWIVSNTRRMWGEEKTEKEYVDRRDSVAMSHTRLQVISRSRVADISVKAEIASTRFMLQHLLCDFLFRSHVLTNGATSFIAFTIDQNVYYIT